MRRYALSVMAALSTVSSGCYSTKTYTIRYSPEPVNQQPSGDLPLTLRFTGELQVEWFSYMTGERPIDSTPIAFVASNTSASEPVLVDWDRSTLVDGSGLAHRVIHGGVRFIERGTSQPKTAIPPLSRVEEVVIPADAVYFESTQYGSSWRTHPLVPLSASSVGSAVRLHLAVVFQGRDYTVTTPLRVTSVDLPPPRSGGPPSSRRPAAGPQ